MDKERKDQQEAATPVVTGDSIGDTIRIRKPPRVFTTVLGQNIWMGEIEPCELELDNAPRTDPYDSAASDDPWAKI